MSEAAIKARFGLDISDLKQNLKSAVSEVANTKRLMSQGFGVTEALKEAVAPLIGLASVGGAFEFLKGSVETATALGTEMENVSKRTGMSVSSVYMLRRAFSEGGIDVEKLSMSVAKMQKYLATTASGGGSSLLRSMGLDSKELAGQSPDQAFRKIGEALNTIPNAAARSTAAIQIFGKSGAELLSVFANPDFKNAGGVSTTAQLLEKNASAFKEYEELQKRVFGGMRNGFSIGFSQEIIPTLTDGLKLLEKYKDAATYVGAALAGYTKGGVIGSVKATFDLKKSLSDKQENAESSNEGFDMSMLGLKGMPIQADSLARIGGGGNYSGDGAVPLLNEQQKQTNLLREIREIMSGRGTYAGTGKLHPVAHF